MPGDRHHGGDDSDHCEQGTDDDPCQSDPALLLHRRNRAQRLQRCHASGSKRRQEGGQNRDDDANEELNDDVLPRPFQPEGQGARVGSASDRQQDSEHDPQGRSDDTQQDRLAENSLPHLTARRSDSPHETDLTASLGQQDEEGRRDDDRTHQQGNGSENHQQVLGDVESLSQVSDGLLLMIGRGLDRRAVLLAGVELGGTLDGGQGLLKVGDELLGSRPVLGLDDPGVKELADVLAAVGRSGLQGVRVVGDSHHLDVLTGDVDGVPDTDVQILGCRLGQRDLTGS